MKRFIDIGVYESKSISTSISQKLSKNIEISVDEFRSYNNIMKEFIGISKRFNKVVNNVKTSNVLSESEKVILTQANNILKLKGFTPISIAKGLIKKEEELEL